MQRHAQLRDTHRDAVQDALLQLASIVDVNSLQTTIKDVLRVVLPDMECVFVYLLEAESRLRCEDPPHEFLFQLQTETQSQCCCLLLVSEDNHQLFCQEERGLLSSLLGFEPNSMLCVPVISQATGQVVALACTFNKLSGQRYMEADEHVIQHCFCYTSTVLTSTLAFQKEQKLKFEYDVSVLLQEIIIEARNLTVLSLSVSEQKEFRIPADQGIAGHVATTGKILNIKDAYSHPLFYRGVDDSTGFRTRNILCFPIKDENEEVIGVAELVNKTNGPWFNRFDEDLATAFSIYCGISIAHVRVSAASLDHSTQYHNGNNLKSICSCCCRFCLMVKKGYRDPPYHNWMHAFSVSHFCYLLYKNLQLSNYLEDIEILALFVSCMCHDLDHRGTNNSFQVDSQSVLAALYSSEGSVMERHHFAQAIAILNTHGCNIFEKFSRKDYQRMLDLMRDIILATDLAHHLRIFRDLQKMADAGYNPRSQAHRSLLLCLLMTSCDLSDQTKGWKTTRKIAELIYKEFFSQGDLEKAMGNRPSEMMDREKAYIPELQISFMEHIAMPIYKLLQEIFPRSAELYERVAANREQWAKVSHKFTIRGLPSNNSLDFLDEEFELLQSQGAFGDDSHRMNGCLDDDCDKHNQ
uniref:Phosphodiesterase n=1 Tax=Sinocyclocheilus grahami TaxID=75366 RepID=A0A672KM56_SINGR